MKLTKEKTVETLEKLLRMYATKEEAAQNFESAMQVLPFKNSEALFREAYQNVFGCSFKVVVE